jgi:hypothetical protein
MTGRWWIEGCPKLETCKWSPEWPWMGWFITYDLGFITDQMGILNQGISEDPWGSSSFVVWVLSRWFYRLLLLLPLGVMFLGR